MKRKFTLLVLATVLFSPNLTAQKNNSKITITGSVVDVYGHPVINAMIMIDGVNAGSVTDQEGNFKVKVKRVAKVIQIVSFNAGMIEAEINGRTEINFRFSKSGLSQFPEQASQEGNEGVNTGYNYVKKKDLNTPANTIDGTNKKYASYSTISEMILRETSGVKLTSGGYVIHDSRDFFGNVPALLVVDGVYVDDISSISPASVESIVILKGTSAAIYGSRGYGGAIVIKTRKQNK